MTGTDGVMSEGVGGSVGADLAAIEARRVDLAAPIEEAAARLWPVVALNLLHGEPAPWGEISETTRNQIRALVGVASASLIAEVSRLGQRLREAQVDVAELEAMHDHQVRVLSDERLTLKRVRAERDASLALVGQLQGQLDAVRALHIPGEAGYAVSADAIGNIETREAYSCAECSRRGVRPVLVAWPCATILAINPSAAAVLSDREGTQ